MGEHAKHSSEKGTCDSPPCEAVGPFRYCPVQGCGWMEGPPHECWTCGAPLDEEQWRSAAREPSNENKRWCVNCHDRVEFSRNPLAIGNMLRHVAGLPPAGDSGRTESERVRDEVLRLRADVAASEAAVSGSFVTPPLHERAKANQDWMEAEDA